MCGNSARTDLCGGRSEMAVPTANNSDDFRVLLRLNVHSRHRSREAVLVNVRPTMQASAISLSP